VAKRHYKYNPETLSYEEVKVTLGKRILKLALWLAPNLLLAIVLGYFLARGVNSPREKALSEELEIVRSELERMNTDMDLIEKALGDIEKRDENMYRLALHAKAFPEELRRMGAGGSDKYESLLELPNGDLLKSSSERIDRIERKLHAQRLSFDELLKLAQQKEKLLACVPAIQPVKNKDLKSAISGFGYRIDPVYKTTHMHTGVDFAADIGKDVYATGDGVVKEIQNNGWGYGKCIIIDHGFGYQTLYAHLSSFKVKVGQKVKRGELIGLVGNTGKSTGPHLHYEVIKDGEKVNPIGFFHSDLTPEQYEQLIEMSNNSNTAFD
jgi:murein DD-endopeptidase MepM/ murein hydrolase activator NlpD